MKSLTAMAALTLTLVLGMAAAPVDAGDVLSGDTRLACEAILCLSSGTRPSECSPSLSRYFGINKRLWSDTIKARFNFLQLCPVADGTAEMRSLTKAISRGAGRCDASSLNMLLKTVSWQHDRYYIGNKMPAFCAAYNTHEYTDLSASAAVYVGEPQKGGFWTEPENYQQALARYKELQKRRAQQWPWQ